MPLGCRQNGNCNSGCNRLNTFDWLSLQDITDVRDDGIVEISFHNGMRKGFYLRPAKVEAFTGDWVVVETDTGRDIGCITLSGELVGLQMRKKKVSPERVKHKIIRKASERDREILQEARDLEKPTLVKARVIARSLGLEMKIGAVEYQADKRKATFYYTADGRVDFRELIRHYAREFRVKIEMRQIGSRQEAGLIGGIGVCGRELCCSTWLTSFKSVTTAAARYQNLAINQAKLSGQCGRLKCCLNYELDTYMEALKDFPKNADKLKTKQGIAVLFKMDIFEGLMYYSYANSKVPGQIYTLPIERVREIKEMNKAGELPEDLMAYVLEIEEPEEEEIGFDSVNEVVELPMEERRKKRRRSKGRKKQSRQAGDKQQDKQKQNNKNRRNRGKKSGKSDGPQKRSDANEPKKTDKPSGKSKKRSNRNRRNRRNKPPKDKK